MIRNMLYHLCPFGHNWEWNIEQLLKRMEVFTGVRSIAIMYKDPSQIDMVKSMFDGVRIDNWITKPNHEMMREAGTFLDLLDTVQKAEGITWFGHTKGTSRDPSSNPTIRPWTRMCYESTLDQVEVVDDLLMNDGFVFAGSFRRFLNLSRSRWHYSGTFFWFRNDIVFGSRNWRKLYPSTAGTSQVAVEAWPATITPDRDRVAVLFLDHTKNLYDPEYMKVVVIPAWTLYLRGKPIDVKRLNNRHRRIAGKSTGPSSARRVERRISVGD